MSLHDRPSYPSLAEPDLSKRASAYGSDRALTTPPHETASASAEKQAPATRTRGRTRLFILLGLALFVIVVLAVILPVYFLVIKPKQTGGGGGNGGGATAGPGVVAEAQTRGGSGSTITLESGKTFTYTNNLGGFWVFDPNNPFDGSAQAQLYTPPLNQSWDYLNNQIFGVNIGGWLVLEPFITPALFQKYNVVDEWSLSVAMAADSAGGGLSQIEDHYKTFITEEDFAQIAGAGLNWVRIPIPFWAIEKYPNEPFLEKVSWQYFLKAISWARKYGLRINLDLHTLPGSQNGWNHSGKSGKVGMMNGVAGYMNAQRSLDYIRIIAEFISQPQYKDVIPFFGIVNEAKVSETDTNAIPKTVIGSFYYEAHRMIREITGKGAGNGPMLSIHDGFIGIGEWSGFMAGSDRIAMDSHPYFAFHDVNGNPVSDFVQRACDWQPGFVNSRSQFGVTTAGEWSNAINDCGLFVNSAEPGTGTRYEGNYLGESTTVFGNCETWNDYTQWSDETKAGFGQLMLSSMDAFQNWFFWTWKIGPSLTSGRVEAPMWSYRLAIDLGFAPSDPRIATGKCAALGKGTPAFTGPYQAWQTGGPGDTGTVVASEAALYGVWPPTTLGQGLLVAQLPAYTATGAIPTLPVPTFTKPDSKETFDAGTGWFNAQDTTPMHVPITGCDYPDQWNAVGIAIPPACPLNTGVPAPAAPGATPSVTAARRWAHPAPTAQA